ncbi:MAG: DUF2169 domain-containing protein [Planctomycetota bacterium]
MLKKNLTTFQLGPQVTSRQPGQLELSLVVRGVFALTPGQPLEPIEDTIAQGFLSGDRWADDDDDRVGELVHASDLAHFKPNAEVLLTATCHTPNGKPMTQCPVGVQVGTWGKQLAVFGDRQWLDTAGGHAPSTPQPFTQMPLRWSRASGGPGVASNPVGRDLPNVEHPQQLVRRRGDKASPDGFSPISPAWAPRAGKIGRNYGKEWKRTRAPFVSDDFDWSWYCAGPADQQLPGYLRGDEAVRLVNLHPQVPVLDTRLPALRLRVVVHTRDARSEMEMQLDTLHLQLDDATHGPRVILLWRGLTPVTDIDLTDVTGLLVASEPMDSEPRPAEHYHAQLDAHIDDPVGLKEHISPEFADAAARNEAAEAAGLSPADLMGPDVPADGAGNPISQLIQNQVGSFAAPEQAQISQALADSAQRYATAAGNVLPPFNQAIGHAIGNVPLAAPPMAGVVPAFQLQQMATAVSKLRADLIADGVDGPALQRLDEFARHPDIAQLDPSFEQAATGPPPPRRASKPSADDVLAPPPRREPPPPLTEPRDLSGYDLSNMDLRGHNFRGCALVGTVFANSTLDGVSFAGADCTQANFYRASLTGCDFSGSTAARALFDRATLTDAVFANATLDESGFSNVVATGATFDGASAASWIVAKSDLTGASAVGLRAPKAIFDDTKLAGVNLSSATCERASFRRVQAPQLNAEHATLAFATFEAATLTGARFGLAQAADTAWHHADLTSADFSAATLERAFFQQAMLTGATLERCDLTQAALRKAIADHANLAGSQLYEASLAGASCRNARFDGASLWRTALLDCDLAGATFAGTTLEHAVIGEAVR